MTLREKWAARWRGLTDAWRDVSIKAEEEYVFRSLDHLIARQNNSMHRYALRLVDRTQECVVPMEQLRNAIRPTPSNALGQAGRDWHNYNNICNAGRAAADKVIGEHKACIVAIDDARASAQAIIDRYVAVVKRFHPRRASLSDWKLKVPPFSEQAIIQQRLNLAQEILAMEFQFTDRGNEYDRNE